ncbi:unnamed protein product [Diatraea saccharalis]|uniref:Uncharacterized protein n=1 Tax=Diatraea saccharalis TaxID=40085 RepID=A0A9N9R5J5_9NEOP|nr:unnamed protein product [Diatraea saccharalis]
MPVLTLVFCGYLENTTGDAPKQLAKCTKLLGLVIKGVLNVLLAGVLLGLVKIIWHLKTYNGGYDNIKKIIEFYEIQKIEHTIKETIQKVTKGLGIVALVELQQRLDNIVKHINKCDKHSLNGALNDTNTITKYNLTAPTKLSAPTNGATTTNITAPTKLSAPTNGATTTNITAPTKLSAPTNGATTTNITAPTKLSAPTNEATTTYITGPTKLSAPTNVAATTNVTAPTNEATTTRVTAPTNDTASTNSNDYYDDDIYYYSGDYYYDDYGAIINGTDPITGADSSSNQSDDISASTQN